MIKNPSYVQKTLIDGPTSIFKLLIRLAGRWILNFKIVAKHVMDNHDMIHNQIHRKISFKNTKVKTYQHNETFYFFPVDFLLRITSFHWSLYDGFNLSRQIRSKSYFGKSLNIFRIKVNKTNIYWSKYGTFTWSLLAAWWSVKSVCELRTFFHLEFYLFKAHMHTFMHM